MAQHGSLSYPTPLAAHERSQKRISAQRLLERHWLVRAKAVAHCSGHARPILTMYSLGTSEQGTHGGGGAGGGGRGRGDGGGGGGGGGGVQSVEVHTSLRSCWQPVSLHTPARSSADEHSLWPRAAHSSDAW